MKFAEIKGLTAAELRQKMLLVRQDYFESKMKHSLGQLSNTNYIREVRKDIARIETALSVRENLSSVGVER